MHGQKLTIGLERFTTFGDLLKFLRRRAGLSQRELSIAVGYSESQISRLEQHQRPPDGAAVAARFPDPAANPYLAFSAMLMAGLDGIENKLNPGDPIDKNLYDLPPEELEKVPTVCGSLRQACEELDKDRAFLKKGNVFIRNYRNLFGT